MVMVWDVGYGIQNIFSIQLGDSVPIAIVFAGDDMDIKVFDMHNRMVYM